MLIVGHDVEFALIKGRVVGDVSLIDGLDSTGFCVPLGLFFFPKHKVIIPMHFFHFNLGICSIILHDCCTVSLSVLIIFLLSRFDIYLLLTYQ